jgi:hypothetical protein
MILLITPSQRGAECAAALERACAEDVEHSVSVRAAMASLRSHAFRAVIIDESLMEMEPVLLESMQRNLGTPIPIYVNFALRNMEHLLRDVQAGLRRSESERVIVMRAAVVELQLELKNAIAGILLSSELALAVPGLPRDAEAKLQCVRDLAQGMRQQLELNGSSCES